MRSPRRWRSRRLGADLLHTFGVRCRAGQALDQACDVGRTQRGHLHDAATRHDHCLIKFGERWPVYGRPTAYRHFDAVTRGAGKHRKHIVTQPVRVLDEHQRTVFPSGRETGSELGCLIARADSHRLPTGSGREFGQPVRASRPVDPHDDHHGPSVAEATTDRLGLVGWRAGR